MPEPWRGGYLDRFIRSDGHIFGAGLKGRAHDLRPIRRAWSGLSDARLEEYRGLLPAEWEPAQRAWEAALTHIRNVRDRIDDCVAELERALR